MSFGYPNLRFYTPSVVIQNITNKTVDIVGLYHLKPGETADLFKVTDPSVGHIEASILRGCQYPYGDLYVEQNVKKSIRILKLDLAEFHYNIISDGSYEATNAPFPGAVPATNADGTWTWVSAAGFAVDAPLEFAGSTLSLPQADGSHDGFLSSTDWSRFNAGGKPDQKIWQYQDYAAPVSSSLVLSAFENGSGVAFNASYVIDGTAEIVLISDTSKAPTTTLSFPGRLLPGNRVRVGSHIGAMVVLNQSPEATLNCRVFYLISLPAAVPYPTNYQEDPNFLNESSFENLDELYVNQNADETIYGVKTFDAALIADASLQIPVGAVDGYYLKSDGSGNASWAPASTITAAYATIQDEGAALTQRQLLNFSGAALTASDNSGAGRTDVVLSQTPASASVVGSGRVVATVGPLAGGGDLTTDRILSMAKATASTDGYLTAADWANFNAKISSPLTTKGDIWVWDSTNTRLPVGRDGYVLTADHTKSTGLTWAPADGSSSGGGTGSLQEAFQRSWFGL